MYAIAVDARCLSRLASRISHVDLFDLASVAPFTRQGLRSALLAVLLVSIASGQIGNVVVSPTSLTVVLGAMLAVASAALLLPVYGVQRRSRQEKRARLAELRARIRSDERAALQNGPEAERARAGLPGLLALEARLENVREWPLDTSSLLRLALYLTLGLGSWLGAALIERLLDRALG